MPQSQYSHHIDHLQELFPRHLLLLNCHQQDRCCLNGNSSFQIAEWEFPKLPRQHFGVDPPARPQRSLQTGQNSTAPESSLPQLGQVRWCPVLMALKPVRPQPEPKARPSSIRSPAKCCRFRTSNRLFRDTSASNRVSEQTSCRSCPAASQIDDDVR